MQQYEIVKNYAKSFTVIFRMNKSYQKILSSTELVEFILNRL